MLTTATYKKVLIKFKPLKVYKEWDPLNSNQGEVAKDSKIGRFLLPATGGHVSISESRLDMWVRSKYKVPAILNPHQRLTISSHEYKTKPRESAFTFYHGYMTFPLLTVLPIIDSIYDFETNQLLFKNNTITTINGLLLTKNPIIL